MMGLEQIQELISEDLQHESDRAIELRDQCPVMASYREGVADGLHRAMVYLDLLVLENKKAAMPASTAVDPLEEDISYNKSIAKTTGLVKEVAENV